MFKNSISNATLEDNSEKMMKYFDDQDLSELLEFDISAKKCKTLDLINERHPFELSIETPNLNTHIDFL